MNTAIPESSGHNTPRPADLAGAPACVEEDHPTIRVRGSQDPQIARIGAARKFVERSPTADDLAGIPVCVAEGENQKAGPRNRHPKP
jgi:hypothetical protein